MALGTLLGKASAKANDWTGAFQTPFGQTLSSIYDPIQQAQAAGTLTYDQANTALTQFNEQWTAYQDAANQWKAQGGDYATVINQNFDANGAFMKTVNMVQQNLTNWTQGLQSSSTTANPTPTSAPTLDTILTGLGMSTNQAAADAAANTQRKAQAETRTILTGGMGLQLSPANLKKKTVLGYA